VGALILLLLLFAALTGVFWAVVKVVAIAVISTILTLLVLGFVLMAYARHRVRRFLSQPPGGGRSGGAYPTRGWKQEPGDDPQKGLKAH
jgi:hypothetical protein